MAHPVGIKAVMGIKRVATWDTAYATVDTAIPYNDETVQQNYERIEKAALLGYGGREPSEQGPSSIPGTINSELDYNNFHADILEMIMGAESGGVVTVVDRIDDEALPCFWLEIDKQVSRHRYGAAMAHKFVLSGSTGQIVMLAWDVAAKDRTLSGTAFPAITPATPTRVRFSDLTFRIADQGDAIASGDAVGISEFEIEFDRQMKLDDYQSHASTPLLPIVPTEGEFRACSLKFTIPRYTGSPDFIGWKIANTPLMADLTFTRGGESYLVQLPELRIIDGFESPVGGPGPLTVEGTLEARRSSSGNPMYVGNEIKITVV